MKMAGKIMLGLVLGILLLSLAGCGTGESPGAPQQGRETDMADTPQESGMVSAWGEADVNASAPHEPGSFQVPDSSQISDNSQTPDAPEAPPSEKYDVTLRIACMVDDLGLVSSGRKLLKDAATKLTYDADVSYAFVYEEPKAGEEDAFYTRTLADLVAGKGPDILYIAPDRLQTLQEKGVLAELTSYLPQETRDNLLPAALQMGAIGDGLYGIPTDFMLVWSLMSTREIWDGDTWTVEQLLDRMEGFRDQENVLLVLESGAPSSELLGNVILMDLENTPFIDWEKRECYFDGELFRRAMQLCRACGRNGVYLGDSGYEAIRQGDCLGVTVAVTNIHGFSQRAAGLGEDIYHCVGMPTEAGSGSFAQTNGILAVNSRCTEPQALTTFLEYLYSREGQAPLRDLYTMSVLRFPADDITDFGNGTRTISGYSYVGLLEEKADGSTYVEDYAAFLDSCVPRPTKYLDVWNMIMEDAEKYLVGDQTLDNVCRVIQSRVQLYLSE